MDVFIFFAGLMVIELVALWLVAIIIVRTLNKLAERRDAK